MRYQVREQCERCGSAGHRRCSLDSRIPSHIIRQKTNPNMLRKTVTVSSFPVLPNISQVKSRVDTGLGKSRSRSRTSSVGSITPCHTPDHRRSISLETEPLSLPPINPQPSPTNGNESEEAVANDRDAATNVEDSLDGPVVSDPPEVEYVEPEVENAEPERENAEPEEENVEPEIEALVQNPEPEITQPEVVPVVAEVPEPMMNGHAHEAEEIEQEKKENLVPQSEPIPPAEKRKIYFQHFHHQGNC